MFEVATIFQRDKRCGSRSNGESPTSYLIISSRITRHVIPVIHLSYHPRCLLNGRLNVRHGRPGWRFQFAFFNTGFLCCCRHHFEKRTFWAWCSCFAYYIAVTIWWSTQLRHIPTLGYQGYLRSYIDACWFTFSGLNILQAAYDKVVSLLCLASNTLIEAVSPIQHHPGVFKISTLHRWLVVVTSTQLQEELRKLPVETLSLTALVGEVSSCTHTIISMNQTSRPRLISLSTTLVMNYSSEGRISRTIRSTLLGTFHF